MDDDRAPAAEGASAEIQLLWIPLGAGASVVRLSGRAFEALTAGVAGRPRRDLFHSALVVHIDGRSTVIEMAPVERGDPTERGAVASGPVGSRWLRRLRVFRYEVRCWPGGRIPDAGAAVGGPISLSGDARGARRLLDLVPTVPTPTWGRDELQCGEMWNSNSVTSWLLGSAGIDVGAPPEHGRAPGWAAGIVEALRRRHPLPS